MKITPDHLARGAFIYIRQSTSTSLPTITRADGVNMALPTVLVLSAGRM
jgi:hypothetical protein